MSKELFTDKRWYENPGIKSVIYQCTTCKYFYGFKRCEAFPNGIPKELLVPEFTHTEAFEGDNGLRYVEGDNRNNRRVPPEIAAGLEDEKKEYQQALAEFKKKQENKNK